MKNIYQLSLNEEILIDYTEFKFTSVRLVPGGWIYVTEITDTDEEGNYHSTLTSCFVPFSKQLGT